MGCFLRSPAAWHHPPQPGHPGRQRVLQQPDIAAPGDQPEAVLDGPLRLRSTRDQPAEALAVLPGRGADPPRRVAERRMVELAGDAERGREVEMPEPERVD